MKIILRIKGQASPALKGLTMKLDPLYRTIYSHTELKHLFCTLLIFLLYTKEYTLQTSYNIRPPWRSTHKTRENISSSYVHNKTHLLHRFFQSLF